MSEVTKSYPAIFRVSADENTSDPYTARVALKVAKAWRRNCHGGEVLVTNTGTDEVLTLSEFTVMVRDLPR